jgi:flagellar hook protein FlgE
MSFYTSLSGLQAAQTEMSTISHNLANVSTNGFKKSRTEFADVIASSVNLSPTHMVGSGTLLLANRQQFGQGSFMQSTSSLDLAVSGDGFFVVKPDANAATVNFTRNGGFSVDPKTQNVVDAQGSSLQVYPVDASGEVTATGLDSTISLKLPERSGNAMPTGNVKLAVNLSAGAGVPAKATFDRFDPTSYNQSAQTTIYDGTGNPLTMTQYFKRETLPTGTPPVSTWSVHSFVGDEELTSGGTAGATLTFDATGKITAPATPIAFDDFTPAGTTATQRLTLDFGTATTQLAAPFNVASRTQDGKAVGLLQGVTVGADGIVKASFSNGDSQALGKVALANFSNPSGLRQLGNSYWASTGVSGEPVGGAAGEKGLGNLMSGTIERSNVDITEELVGLIAAQRNFQANAKALDTASQISQTIFNIRS